MYPHMYVGDASYATKEKGKVLVDYQIQSFVDLIQTVKRDDITPGLVEDFNFRQKDPKAPGFWTER